MQQISNQLESIDEVAPLPENQGLSDIATTTSHNDILKSMWNLNAGALDEAVNVSKVYNTKHGLFASVPIICRGTACPYKDTCMVKLSRRKVGQRCPMEIGTIMSRFTMYCQHFDIDISNPIIEPENLVDITLVKDVVTTEVSMIRAENKIAINGDFMAETLLDIDKKCNPYFGKIVSPEQEILMTLQDKKQKALNQLNATRKDKAKEMQNASPSENALKICSEIKDIVSKQNIDISEMEFDDAEVVEPGDDIDRTIEDSIAPMASGENTDTTEAEINKGEGVF